MKINVQFEIEFRKNPYKGKYFAIEGIDGSGKSTQIEDVRKKLSAKGLNVVTTTEPRVDSPIGTLIHSILQGKVKVDYEAIQYLMSAERVTNHQELVEPSLKSGKIVLSHRCLWSNVPYGMLDRGVTNYDSSDPTFIDIAHGLMSRYHQFIVPDMTFYLRVSIDTAVQRLSKMNKIKESYEKSEKLEKIAKGYEWQIKKYPEMFTVIDGEQDEEKITEQIVSEILKQV